MKQLSKEQWRNIHGIRPPKDPADPEVLQRRWLHEAIVRWEIKWLTFLHITFAVLAFAIVFLPSLNKSWHAIISTTPILSWIFGAFSRLSSTLISCLSFGLISHLYSSSQADGKDYSEHGYPINLSHIGSPINIALGELYPRTRIEEKIFLVDSAGALWLATVSWFVLFGGLSILIRLGGG